PKIVSTPWSASARSTISAPVSVSLSPVFAACVAVLLFPSISAVLESPVPEKKKGPLGPFTCARRSVPSLTDRRRGAYEYELPPGHGVFSQIHCRKSQYRFAPAPSTRQRGQE